MKDELTTKMNEPITITMPAKHLALIRTVMREDIANSALELVKAVVAGDKRAAEDNRAHGECVLDVLDNLEAFIQSSALMQRLSTLAKEYADEMDVDLDAFESETLETIQDMIKAHGGLN